MNERDVFVLSERAFNDVVQQIPDNLWSARLPEWFALGRNGDRANTTLRTIINYHAYDTAWVPEVLAGETLDEVGDRYDGDLLGEHPKDAYAAFSESAIASANELDDSQKTVHLSYGDFTAQEYFVHITSFRGYRAYDVAKLIGIGTDLPPELVEGMWNEFAPRAEQWRSMGVFGAEVSLPPNASQQDRLLAMSGRDPYAK